VEDDASGTTRRLVRASSFASSSACGSVCSGGFVTSGIGQIEIDSSLDEAIQRSSGEIARPNTGPLCPNSR